jgi:hypothetical protein
MGMASTLAQFAQPPPKFKMPPDKNNTYYSGGLRA